MKYISRNKYENYIPSFTKLSANCTMIGDVERDVTVWKIFWIQPAKNLHARVHAHMCKRANQRAKEQGRNEKEVGLRAIHTYNGRLYNGNCQLLWF